MSMAWKIDRVERDGWFVYTCADLPGLLIASPDDAKARGDIGLSISMLLRLDDGIDLPNPAFQIQE